MPISWFPADIDFILNNLAFTSLQHHDRSVFFTLLAYCYRNSDTPQFEITLNQLSHLLRLQKNRCLKCLERLEYAKILSLSRTADVQLLTVRVQVQTDVFFRHKVAWSQRVSAINARYKKIKTNEPSLVSSNELRTKSNRSQTEGQDLDKTNIREKNIPPNPLSGGFTAPKLFEDDCGEAVDPNQEAILFSAFWSAYPKKVGKPRAQAAWRRINPNNGVSEAIMTGLESWKLCEQWLRDSGAYIPYPATWLNDHRWEYNPSSDGKLLTPAERWYKSTLGDNSNAEDDKDSE